MEKISIKLAKEISLVKWEAELNNCSYLYELKEKFPDLYNEIKDHFDCGFCLRHGYNHYDKENISKCNNCEFGKIAGKCTEDDSLYNRIGDSEEESEESEELIKELIEIIKNIPEEDE